MSMRVNSDENASVPVGDVKVKVAVVLGPVNLTVDTSRRSWRIAASCRRTISVGTLNEMEVFVGADV